MIRDYHGISRWKVHGGRTTGENRNWWKAFTDTMMEDVPQVMRVKFRGHRWKLWREAHYPVPPVLTRKIIWSHNAQWDLWLRIPNERLEEHHSRTPRAIRYIDTATIRLLRADAMSANRRVESVANRCADEIERCAWDTDRWGDRSGLGLRDGDSGRQGCRRSGGQVLLEGSAHI